MKRRVLFRVKDDLGETITVSNINKDDPAMVASAGHPTGQGDRLANLRERQFTAMMRSYHEETSFQYLQENFMEFVLMLLKKPASKYDAVMSFFVVYYGGVAGW